MRVVIKRGISGAPDDSGTQSGKATTGDLEAHRTTKACLPALKHTITGEAGGLAKSTAGRGSGEKTGLPKISPHVSAVADLGEPMGLASSAPPSSA